MKKLDMRDKVSTRLNGEHNTYLCGGPNQSVVQLINDIKSGSSDPNAEPPSIMPQLVPVVRELASYAPQWQYFFPITFSGANKLNEMYIISEGETIGWVQYDNSYSQDYLYDSRSLTAKRERGNCSRTKKADKLIAALKKNVRARTVDERLVEVSSKGLSAVQNAIYRSSNTYRARRDGLFGDVATNLLANWEQVADVAGMPPAARDIGLELFAGQAEHMEGIRLSGTMEANTVAVLVDGNRFLVRRYEDKTYKTMQREEAPEAVRTALGILKMCPPEEYVAGFGMRHTDDTFTIIYEGDL
jgi:hypothetical protein